MDENLNNKITQINSKDEFLDYVKDYHKQATDELAPLVNRDWTFMEKTFGQKGLIKIARDQRILKAKSRFDMMNKCDDIVHEVIISTAKAKAKELLTLLTLKGEMGLGVEVDRMFAEYIIATNSTKTKLVEFLNDKQEELKKYEGNNFLYDTLNDDILFQRSFYFKGSKRRAEALEKNLEAIEKKFR